MATAIPPTPGATTGTAESAAPPTGPWGRFKAFKEKNHLAFEVAFFFAGFAFDAVLLHRIDSRPLLIHQGTYIVLLTFLIGLDHRILVSGQEPKGFWGKVLGFRTWVIHFFLGTLLNAFIIFYFKAASGKSIGGIVFMVLLAGFMIVNELPRFRKYGPMLRVALLSFAVTSFLAYLLPVLLGFLHPWQYYLSIAVGSAATYGLWRVYSKFTHDPTWTFKRAVLPGLIIQALLLVAYVAKVVPPVPLSLKYIGVFHEVAKDPSGEYQLSYVWPPSGLPHLFEYNGAEFYARPDDKAVAFVMVFAPKGFEDRIGFAWQYDDPKQGWVDVGTPYFTTLGRSHGDNREEGFRTFGNRTVKNPGDYRVMVVTEDGREIGRMGFTVIRDASTEPRQFSQLLK